MHQVHVLSKLLLVMTIVIISKGAFAKIIANEHNKSCNQNISATSTDVYYIEQSKNQTKESRSIFSKQDSEGRKKQEGMMTRIMPLMIIPFMISTGIIPMMLVSLKIMVLKSAFIGKLAVILLILNLFRSRSTGQGGVFTHNVNERDMSIVHYGYSGDEEYGAYINRRKRESS